MLEAIMVVADLLWERSDFALLFFDSIKSTVLLFFLVSIFAVLLRSSVFIIVVPVVSG